MLANTWGSLVMTRAAWEMKFRGSVRIDFYEGFQSLVENGLSVDDALKELHKVWSYDGTQRDEPLAVVARDLLLQLKDGMSLSRALSRWVPYEEASLLAAGEQVGSLVQTCDDVIRVITAKQQISGAVASAVVYPTFLCIPLSYLLWIVGVKMVPKMAQVSDPEHWTGAAFTLYQLANFVTGYGLSVILLLIALVIVFLVSLPRWTGSRRMLADKGPFYSTYRIIHGSTFLLNLSVMMRANITELRALEMLSEYASPWLKERIAGAIVGLKMGNNLGAALDNAGHQFPDKKAIQFIRILASRNGFSKSINNYSDRWLKASIKRMQSLAKVAFMSMLILIGCVMALVVAGTQEMQNNLDQTTNRTSSKVVSP